ncbi:MAG TPA: molybdopterin-dependent oxidoreductase, partial [Rhodopila sp.]
MADAVNQQKIQGYCALCIARCGSISTVQDGRFIALDPDPSHPTGQALCAKGRAAPELVYSPDRLLHPLKRTRPKGDPDPGWQQISWEEALDTTASAMRRIERQGGPEAMAFSLSSPSTTSISDSNAWIRRLMLAFGSPNSANNIEQCGWGRGYATRYTFGVASIGLGGGAGAMPDIANSGCLILWGYNPSISRLTHATAAVEALKRGMRLIVIDPRHTGLANKADVWLRVRPGTDCALALGLANLMIQHGWYDRSFVREWSNGPFLVRSDTGRLLTAQDLDPDGNPRHNFAWDAAASRLVAHDPATGRYETDAVDLALDGEYRVETTTHEVLCRPSFALFAELCRQHPPEAVEATCWIDRNALERAARMIWESRPVSYYAYAGHEHHTNTTQTARAMSLLYALTGSFDQSGGNVMFPAIPSPPITGEDLPTAKRMAPVVGLAQRPLGPARWNMIANNALYDAILDKRPYPIRGLLGFGANLLVGRTNVQRGREALKALEFYAHADLFMTPTAEMADIILPTASAFERAALKIGFDVTPEAQSLIQFRQAVVPPRGEARADIDIVFDLACRLGLGEYFWNGDVQAGYRYQLEPSGVSLEALQASPQGIRVPLRTRHAKYAELDASGVPTGFATPSRKVELFSETFLNHGYPPLPVFREPMISPVARPDLAARYPLVLTSVKSPLFCASQHRALPSLRKRALHPEVEIHPETAASRGINAGDWVAIETPEARIKVRARFNPSLDPRVVAGQNGWWQACKELDAPGYEPFGPEGANYNLLISGNALDPIS